jgi:quercetin dioxygenase-like cupin family protein
MSTMPGHDRTHDQPGSVTDLTRLSDELLGEAAATGPRRAARTLVAVGPLRQTVIAMLAGARLADHENPGAATVQVLRGTAVLHTAAQQWRLGAGSLHQIPDERHGLRAEEDSVVVLTVALGASR